MKQLTAFFVGVVFSLGVVVGFADETSTSTDSVSDNGNTYSVSDNGDTERLDINVAGAEELAAAIKGVGRIRSQRIIAWREEHGRFQSVDELTNVSGIGPHIVENSRHRLIVVPPPSQ